jgi:hypothetical protein
MEAREHAELGEYTQVDLKLERFYRGRRLSSLLLKVFGGACVVSLSFLITLAVLDHLRSDDVAATDEVKIAIEKGVPTPAGLRVYSPAESNSASSAVGAAFDGSRAAASFWEAHEFPIDLIVLLPEPRKLTKYAIAAGEVSDRMPRSWAVKGSADGQNWIDLGGQRNVPMWNPDEIRRYDLRTAAPVRVLRFRFDAGFDAKILRIYEIELG